jgi:hypothetical protein
MAIFSVSARKKRKKKKKRHHAAKKHPAPKKRKPSPPPQPAPKPPTQPHAPSPTPGTGSGGTGTAGKTTALVATARERLFLNRFGTGFTQDALKQLRAAGTTEAWLEQQMTPSSVAEAAKVAEVDGWFSYLWAPVTAKVAANGDGSMPAWKYGHNLGNWTILRRIYSRRSVLETMTDFWSTNLHIPVGHDRAWLYRADYDATIRQHAFGTFEDLLVALSLHPAMRLYLDNWSSVKNKPNENQGRELLELHTVGRGAGYTEAMVKDSAKILSGYTVDWGKTYAEKYDSARHTTGAVSVLGFSDPNAAPEGQSLTVAYLKYLAHHPATATRIATKLCRHFVADEPSDALVAAVAKAFTDSGTDIKTTLRALVAHPDFLAGRGLLVRNPVEDFVATCRVLGVQVQAPTDGSSFARACIWLPETTLLYQWPRPDGLPLGDAAWSSATRMLNSFRMHWNLAAGWWPTKDVVYRNNGAAWLPRSSLRLDEYVEHLSRSVLGKPADARILAAVYGVTGYTASTVVSASHQVAGWMHVHVMGVLLDSPDHMRR